MHDQTHDRTPVTRTLHVPGREAVALTAVFPPRPKARPGIAVPAMTPRVDPPNEQSAAEYRFRDDADRRAVLRADRRDRDREISAPATIRF